jgi:hypothetical protein
MGIQATMRAMVLQLQLSFMSPTAYLAATEGARVALVNGTGPPLADLRGANFQRRKLQEGSGVEPGTGEEAGEQAGPVLHPL